MARLTFAKGLAPIGFVVTTLIASFGVSRADELDDAYADALFDFGVNYAFAETFWERCETRYTNIAAIVLAGSYPLAPDDLQDARDEWAGVTPWDYSTSHSNLVADAH